MKVDFETGHHLKFIEKDLEMDERSYITQRKEESIISIVESNNTIQPKDGSEFLNASIFIGE